MSDFAGSSALESVLEEYVRLVRTDPEFRARLRAEPAATLAERGMPAAPGTELRVVEDRADVYHFVLPPNPNAVLADRRLRAVAGGVTADIVSILPHLHLLQPR